MNAYFKTENLSVGYNKKVLIRDINISLEKGKILTLIGPNGSGKSTILKSISRQIPLIGGRVCIDGRDISRWDLKTMAKTVSVMLTDRIRTDMMTCFDVVATGRYPYTGRLGILSQEDEEKVDQALDAVHARDLGNRDFTAISASSM